MKHIKILFALLIGICATSFVYEYQKGNPPLKVYREGDAIINVWENKSKDDKSYFSYQVEKEYTKDGIKKYSSSFYKDELKDLKKVVDQVVNDIEK